MAEVKAVTHTGGEIIVQRRAEQRSMEWSPLVQATFPDQSTHSQTSVEEFNPLQNKYQMN